MTQIAGRIRGIQQMLLDGLKLVASGLTYCLNDPEQVAREGYDIDDVQRMCMKLA